MRHSKALFRRNDATLNKNESSEGAALQQRHSKGMMREQWFSLMTCAYSLRCPLK
jgi:hypothetical protein